MHFLKELPIQKSGIAKNNSITSLSSSLNSCFNCLKSFLELVQPMLHTSTLTENHILLCYSSTFKAF